MHGHMNVKVLGVLLYAVNLYPVGCVEVCIHMGGGIIIHPVLFVFSEFYLILTVGRRTFCDHIENSRHSYGAD
jgi:hypothetical protein